MEDPRTNKGRRQEVKDKLYRKRLSQLGLKERKGANYWAYKSHGSPCSCFMCSPYKFSRKVKHKRLEQE